MPRTLFWTALLLVLLALGAFLVLRPAGSGPPRRATSPQAAPPEQFPGGAAPVPPSSGRPAPDRPAPASPSTAAAPLEALRAALASGDAKAARRAAFDLRRALRGDPAARALVAALLLDPGEPAGVRGAVALVLGTVDRPDVDPALRAALERFADDPAFARCVLLALGATREPEEDDEVFDLGFRPFGAEGPGGLGITVRRRIDDAESRAAVAGCLARPEPGVRGAAAAALRHTLDDPVARDAFLAALAAEGDDEVAPILGESLAERAGRTEDGGERKRLVDALLARAGDGGLDAYRFRMENDFRRIPLDGEGVATLEELASEARPFGTRSFALTALAAAAPRSGPEAVAAARRLLEGILGRDPEAAARDLAARLLRGLPADPGTAAALARAAREDGAWSVRFTALETLARVAPREAALEALRAARSDPHARVAARAGELLERLSPADYGK